MSGALRTLLNGGRKIWLKPPLCSRYTPPVRNNDAPNTELPDIPYWENPPPLHDVGETYAEILPPSLIDSKATKLRRRSSTTIASFLRPHVFASRLQAADSIISIVFGLRRLAWAHVDRTLTVRDWQQHDWSILKGKPEVDVYLDDVSSVVSKFPAADLYILEKTVLSIQNTSLFPVTLHLRIVEAMLYVLLNPDYPAEHRVFSMSRNIVGKHFNVMVGHSKTSGVELVKQLVEESTTAQQPRIHFTPELLLHYRRHVQPRGHERHEEMCDALMQAITFYDFLKKY